MKPNPQHRESAVVAAALIGIIWASSQVVDELRPLIRRMKKKRRGGR